MQRKRRPCKAAMDRKKVPSSGTPVRRPDPPTTSPKQIGILLCDELPQERARRFGTYAGMFVRLLRSVEPALSFRTFHVQEGELPGTRDDCDAYLITGSSASVYEDLPWLPPLSACVRRLFAEGRKIVGICFGHQLLAHALGGRTERAPQGWGVGVAKVRIVKRLPWMIPPLDTVSLLVSHQDQVMQLPPGAQRIGTNDFCPNSIFHVGERVFAFQGHPEFSRSYLECLMRSRIEQIGRTRFEEAMRSLDSALNDREVARWIIRFVSFQSPKGGIPCDGSFPYR